MGRKEDPVNLMKKFWIIILLSLAGLALLSLPQRASAGPLPQSVYQTPTPGPDGRILYFVKGGETCLSIALKNNVSIDQLRGLNNLNADCTILPGQELLLSIAAPVDATATLSGPAPTATPLLPTPTPFNGTGEVCVVLFNDVNGNGAREDAETMIADGQVSMVARTGKSTYEGSTGPEALCWKDVPENDYNVTVAIPNGYNATTVMNYALPLKAGDTASLDFGAQVSSSSEAAQPSVSEGGRSPLMGILGGLLLLGGMGLGLYVVRLRK